jgi:hypothetical protein
LFISIGTYLKHTKIVVTHRSVPDLGVCDIKRGSGGEMEAEIDPLSKTGKLLYNFIME